MTEIENIYRVIEVVIEMLKNEVMYCKSRTKFMCGDLQPHDMQYKENLHIKQHIILLKKIDIMLINEDELKFMANKDNIFDELYKLRDRCVEKQCLEIELKNNAATKQKVNKI